MSQQPTQQDIIGAFLKDENADPHPVAKIAPPIEQPISAGEGFAIFCPVSRRMKYVGPRLVGIACLIAIGVVGNHIRQARRHHQQQNDIGKANFDAFMNETPADSLEKDVSPATQYQNIKIGMTIAEIDNLLAVKGVETESAGKLLKNMVLYRWDHPNYPENVVLCVFQNGRLTSKRLD